MANALERTSERSRSIVAELRGRLVGLGKARRDRIVQKVGDHWIAWRSERHGRVFAEVRPLRERVEVFILPRPGDLRDPSGLARRAPATQGWGWFRSRFDVRSADEVPSAFRLIAQSYDHGRHVPNGRAPRRRRAAPGPRPKRLIRPALSSASSATRVRRIAFGRTRGSWGDTWPRTRRLP